MFKFFQKINNLKPCIFFVIISFWLSIEINAQETNALGPSDSIPEMTIKFSPKKNLDISFGGAIWVRSTYQSFAQPSVVNRRGGAYFDQFRISVSGRQQFEGRKSWLSFDAQIRWWSYMTVFHTMQLGFHLDEHHSFQLGVTRVPFGMLVATANSFWYSLGFYHGIEDDRDAGVVYRYLNGPMELQLAYFANEELNDPSNLERFSGDLVFSDDQQNRERNQGNGRIAYTLGHGTSNTLQLGLSGEIGQVFNRITEQSGSRWQAALHADANIGRTNLKTQFSRYEYNVKNPEGVDDRLVLMGLFADQRLIAAKANILNANINRHWDVDSRILTSLSTYVDYSHVFKDVDSFYDSQLINPGLYMEIGQFHVWGDILWGKNAWWFNDDFENSGPGQGSRRPEAWEFRMLLTMGWFF